MLLQEPKPVIATDVDGILIKWQSGLPYFAQKYNLPLDEILKTIANDSFVAPAKLFNCSEEFASKLLLKYNNSDFIRYLSAYDDALKVVNELKKTYDFVAVTALGNSVDAHLNRQFNLNALFPDAFKDIFVCDYNESKDHLLTRVLEKYGDRCVCYVDDLGKHIDSATEVFIGSVKDFKTFYLPRGERDHLPKYSGSAHMTVKNWYEIKDILMSEITSGFVKKLQEMLVEEKPNPAYQLPHFFDPDSSPFGPRPHFFDPYDGRRAPNWPNYSTEYLSNRPTAVNVKV
ncbi:hypothetical protein CkP1_0217 [Citrobacter phage CkP1]|nr:hypothetical protein CkP1_0217 [Citrobacter phage CkP1]